MEKPLSAEELCQYLARLRDLLQQRGASTLAERVQFASRFAAGSTTELYGEARNALKKVLAEHGTVLREQDLRELRETLKGIDTEFKLIGGA